MKHACADAILANLAPIAAPPNSETAAAERKRGRQRAGAQVNQAGANFRAACRDLGVVEPFCTPELAYGLVRAFRDRAIEPAVIAEIFQLGQAWLRADEPKNEGAARSKRQAPNAAPTPRPEEPEEAAHESVPAGELTPPAAAPDPNPETPHIDDSAAIAGSAAPEVTSTAADLGNAPAAADGPSNSEAPNTAVANSSTGPDPRPHDTPADVVHEAATTPKFGHAQASDARVDSNEAKVALTPLRSGQPDENSAPLAPLRRPPPLRRFPAPVELIAASQPPAQEPIS